MRNTLNKTLPRALLLLALLTFVLVGAAVAAPPNPFTGGWEATDIDGSNLRMAISGGGGTLRMRWMDDGWSLCGGGPAGIGVGTGEVDAVDPNVLHTSWDFFCSGSLALEIDFEFVYDPTTDTFTIVDHPEEPVTWSRLGG